MADNDRLKVPDGVDEPIPVLAPKNVDLSIGFDVATGRAALVMHFIDEKGKSRDIAASGGNAAILVVGIASSLFHPDTDKKLHDDFVKMLHKLGMSFNV